MFTPDAEVIDNDIAQESEDPWVEFIRNSDLEAETFRGYMVDYYREAPYVARHVDLFSRYLDRKSTRLNSSHT